MSRTAVAASFAVALAALPIAASADAFSSVSYGVHISSTGDGITLEKPLLYDFSMRLETNSLSVSQQLNYDNTRYVSTSRTQNLGIIADFRPYGGRYRISGGLLFGGDRIDNVSQPEGNTIQVGNGLYPVSGTGTVSSRVQFNRPAIYAGVGTGTGLIKGLALTFDAGVLVRNGTVSSTATGPLLANPAFQADLARLQGELRTRIVTPVVSVGLVFRP
ncbi:MAG TPA: hypothetical protein VMA36_14480 [Candidatus Limnocylindria bacterium]|jgi:hypothetical protein|nr:hypothetical protein [Candidatus Limnocylindria bacterium]